MILLNAFISAVEQPRIPVYFPKDDENITWNEAQDRYGLSEFIAWKGTTVTVDKTLLVEQFVKTL